MHSRRCHIIYIVFFVVLVCKSQSVSLTSKRQIMKVKVTQHDDEYFTPSLSCRGGGIPTNIRRTKIFSEAWQFFGINTVIYHSLSLCMEKFFDPFCFIVVINSIVFILWSIARRTQIGCDILSFAKWFGIDLRAFNCANMGGAFLAPNNWRGRNGMRNHPLSFFGSAFSHYCPGHFFTNICTLFSLRPFINQLKRKTFVRLYLFSIAMSQLISITWYEICRYSLASKSHGASGALCGLIAYQICSDYSMSYITYQIPGIALKINAALVLIVGQFAYDIAGVLSSPQIWGAGWFVRKFLLKSKEDFRTGKKKFDESLRTINFTAHIGGALGGTIMVYWQRIRASRRWMRR
mmetsp:Transcript_1463/g.2626  ORF Transcript_1463/g.2626 Transcript_1463/m.2626 type:complete len:349 (-) Transcript_1463:741-1787(-)